MGELASALYACKVTHVRLRPRRHKLRYRVFYLLLDLDEIESLHRNLRFFSHNHFNLFSFRDADHGDGSATPLREQVQRTLRIAGIEAGGTIRLLTMPRILGYAFNPLSVYFCYRNDGLLAAILYEVNNTFRQRHSYLAPVTARSNDLIRQESQKVLYVSPFLTTDMTYSFAVIPPGPRVAVSITASDDKAPLIHARLASERRQPLTNKALTEAFFTYPCLTLKVIAGIHFEALLLWLKGIRLQRRPPPPKHTITVGSQKPPHAASDRKDSSHVH